MQKDEVVFLGMTTFQLEAVFMVYIASLVICYAGVFSKKGHLLTYDEEAIKTLLAIIGALPLVNTFLAAFVLGISFLSEDSKKV